MTRLYLATIFLAAAPVASQCFTPIGTLVADATSIADTIYPSQPIGFAFPLDGQTYTDIHLSDHCFAFLSNAGTPTVPAGGAITYNVDINDFIGNGPCISPFWSDTTLGTGGTLTIFSSPTQCVVTWNNVQTFASQLPAFSVQMILKPSGEVEFYYSIDTDNRPSTFTGMFADAIVGITPGQGAALPPASDMSATPTTIEATIWEEFITANTFDMADMGVQLIPTSPGWVAAPIAGPLSSLICAEIEQYGAPCGGNRRAFYEEFPGATVDITSGTTMTLIRLPGGYFVTDTIPGTFVPPTGAAYNVAAGLLDGDETVALSTPMPIPGGTTTMLNTTTKSQISLTGVTVGNDFSPTAAEMLAYVEPVICPLWHDFDQTAAGSGLILFEEISGIAYLTWDGVFTFGGGSIPERFQVQFDLATGNITVVYVDIANDSLDYVIGYKAVGAVQDPGASDLSVDLTTSFEVDDADSTLRLAATRPVIGDDWDLTTSGIDPVSPLTVTFFGTAQAPTPVPLSAIGIDAPDCFIHINTVLASLSGINVGGVSTVGFPIPGNAALIGGTLSAQSLGLTLGNGANLYTSNGVLGTLGQ